MDDLGEEDPISITFQHRRIPHGKSDRKGHSRGKGQSRGAGNKPFDPLRAVGMYEVKQGALSQSLSSESSSVSEQTSSSSTGSHFIIHELTTQENGFVATFYLGGIHGIGLLSGSRKILQSIVDEYDGDETESESEIDDADEDGVKDEIKQASERKSDGERVDSATNEDEEGDENEHGDREKSELEAEDERINRRAQAFEKNSFRNPKFWMQWKVYGHDHLPSGHQTGVPAKENDNDNDNDNSVEEKQMAYIVFSGNDCAKFEGTVSSQRFGWDNVKIKGHKIKSKVPGCPVRWNKGSSLA